VSKQFALAAYRAAASPNQTNRTTAPRPARASPPGDELVALGRDRFGAKDAARGLITQPDGTYNFVRTQGVRRMDQRLLISAKAGHVQLAQGAPVIYAGTVRFSGGTLDWWSNYSGHYQPIAAFRAQAQLPEDKFVPWQRLQLGGTAMQRGMFRDRRAGGAPAANSAAKDDGNASSSQPAAPKRAAAPKRQG
jgi:hypothetical protein